MAVQNGEAALVWTRRGREDAANGGSLRFGRGRGCQLRMALCGVCGGWRGIGWQCVIQKTPACQNCVDRLVDDYIHTSIHILQ